MYQINKAIAISFLLAILGFFWCLSDNSEEENISTILVTSITILGNTITDGSTNQLTVQISPSNV